MVKAASRKGKEENISPNSKKGKFLT